MVKQALFGFTSHGQKPEENLKTVLHLMADYAELKKISSVFKTMDDVRSLRVVVKVNIHVPFEMLLSFFSEAESRLKVTGHILLIEEDVMMRPDMPIPHPDLHETAHWLVPSAELWPEAHHPVLKKTLKSLSTTLPNRPWGEFVAQGKTLLDFSDHQA